jgi:hypothetical protein
MISAAFLWIGYTYWGASHPVPGVVAYSCGCSTCFCVNSLGQGRHIVEAALLENTTLCLPSQPWIRTMVLSINAKRFAYQRAWLAGVSIVPNVFLGLNKAPYPKLANISDKYVHMKVSVIRMLQAVADSDRDDNEWTLLLEDDAYMQILTPQHAFQSIVERGMKDAADVGWLYFCSFPAWAANLNVSYSLAVGKNHSIDVYSYRQATHNTVAYAITKWRAKLVVEYMFKCWYHVHDECFKAYQQSEKVTPLVVFLDHTTTWPGLFGQMRAHDNYFRPPENHSFASVAEMQEVTRRPRSPSLCNSRELVRRDVAYGDTVVNAETGFNFSSFFFRLTPAARVALGFGE